MIDAAEIEMVHEMVTKPMVMSEVADNPLVQHAHQNIDQLFAAIRDPNFRR